MDERLLGEGQNDKNDMSEELLKKRIKETHDSDWLRFGGLHSLFAIALPILSEFEGLGENVFMVMGGTAAVTVFSILLKIARVGIAVQDIYTEQDEINKDDHKEYVEKIVSERKRKKESKYAISPPEADLRLQLLSPIEWQKELSKRIKEKNTT